MDVAAYLARMGYRGSTTASPEALAELQLAHLLAVPFENLSIHIGEAIQLRADWLWGKIVVRRRGGFCYELNGLFAELLLALGYDVQRLSARVIGEGARLGIPFDHMCLRVVVGGEAWLVDVGFGDNFVRPLRLDEPGEQSDGRRRFRVERDGDERVLWDGDKPSFRFGLLPHALADFEPGCRHHQTSPESPFTQKRVVTRLTPDGRITLTADRLLTTGPGGEKREEPVADEGEWRRLAEERFGVVYLGS